MCVNDGDFGNLRGQKENIIIDQGKERKNINWTNNFLKTITQKKRLAGRP